MIVEAAMFEFEDTGGAKEPGTDALMKYSGEAGRR
jgi:hypothetical protein